MHTQVQSIIDQLRPYQTADRFAFQVAASTYLVGRDLRKAIVEHITKQPAKPSQCTVAATCEVLQGYVQQATLF